MDFPYVERQIDCPVSAVGCQNLELDKSITVQIINRKQGAYIIRTGKITLFTYSLQAIKNQ